MPHQLKIKLKMNKTVFYLSSLFIVLTSSCSELQSDTPCVSPNSYVVAISGDSVKMSTGSLCSIDFSITAINLDLPDLSMDSSNYTIELRLADNNTTPINYKLARIEAINSIGGTNPTAFYRAYVEDLCLKNNYCDQVKLVLRDKIKDTSHMSSIFTISYNCDSLTKSLLETALPLIVINTINNEEPTCEYVSAPDGCIGQGIINATKVPGSLSIMKDADIVYYSKAYKKGESGMTLKIRGNTSAYTEKKPYKIKLEKKADLLNRSNPKTYEDKEWVLLKYDKLRALVGFKLNELMQMQWTPSFQFANVIINGDFRGLYMLAESVKRNTDCRLNVDKTGYIIEYDAYWWNEEVFFESEWAYLFNYTFKYPDDKDITEEQLDYIKSYIENLEISINNEGAYENYIDVESWAKWILAHDILGTYDGGSNPYMTKYDNTTSSKLMMANLWDFDSNYMREDTWSSAHISTDIYFNKLINNGNSLFRDTYKRIWEENHLNLFKEMNDYLSAFGKSENATHLEKAIIYDNMRWNDKQETVSKEIQYAKSWFMSRQSFLNENIPNL